MEKNTHNSELQHLYCASASTVIRLRRISLKEYAARMGEVGKALTLIRKPEGSIKCGICEGNRECDIMVFERNTSVNMWTGHG